MAVKRPLLQKQAIENALQAAIHEHWAMGAGADRIPQYARLLRGLRVDRVLACAEGAQNTGTGCVDLGIS